MDVNAIFDVAIAAGKQIHIEHLISEKKAQIRGVNEKRCGNCDHWMKTSCVPEKKHKQFKSINSFACKDFIQCWSSSDLADKFKAELKELHNKALELTPKNRRNSA